MADTVLSEYLSLPKKPRLDKSSVESKSSYRRREFRKLDPYDDEYIRQYLLYYYQFHKSEGFVIDWDKLDYRFDDILPIMGPYPFSQSRTNDELIRDVACRAISKYNEETGTKIEFLDHVSARYRWCAEIAAFQVEPPLPLYENNPGKPTILFTVTGPGSGYMSIPNVEFTRIPAEEEYVSSPESSP